MPDAHVKFGLIVTLVLFIWTLWAEARDRAREEELEDETIPQTTELQDHDVLPDQKA